MRIGAGGLDAFEGDRDLELEDLVGEVGLALFEVLADADDGDEAMGERGLELEVDGGVGLVEVLAALGVADEDVGGADGGEHEGRGLAGVGAVVEPVHGLGADVDGLAFGGVDERRRARSWRGRERSRRDVMGDEGKEGVDEGDGFGGGLVHLPVGGD